MASGSVPEKLSREYRETFAQAVIRPERRAAVQKIVERIFSEASLRRYAAVAAQTGVPVHVIGILHSLECSLSFQKHLHNGDPLTARTIHVPKDRPATGQPPFSWEESALDALRLEKLDTWTDWSLPGVAYALERFNGFGYRYRKPPVQSPYLWSFTTAYVSGKYLADHVWSDTAVSHQCGGMALLRGMVDEGRVVVPERREALSPRWVKGLAPGSKGPAGPSPG